MLEQALRREAREELGVELEQVRPLLFLDLPAACSHESIGARVVAGVCMDLVRGKRLERSDH